MFFVLYPVGIASECTLTYLSLGPARQVHDLFAGLFVVVLLIYVPGWCHYLLPLSLFLNNDA